jgi:hypothetical protein
MISALKTAIKAQEDAHALAIAMGDMDEEKRRMAALMRLRRQERTSERSEGEFVGVILQMQRSAKQRGRTSWLAKLASDGPVRLSEAHLRTAMILRDHVEGAVSASTAQNERVDGGHIHNGQLEALMDRRRALRYALNAAIEAIEDDRLVPLALMVIIRDCSPRAACTRWGVAWHGRMQGRIVGAIAEALDAAAAHIGVSR